jgi:hypothetical protein
MEILIEKKAIISDARWASLVIEGCKRWHMEMK